MAERSVEQAGQEEKRYPEKPKDWRFKDLEGVVFGRMTVERYRGRQGGHTLWECRCECGIVKDVTSGVLQRPDYKSCGCYLKEIRGQSSIKHGMSESSEFEIWMGIQGRCYNTNNDAYKDYGGRGISMCDEWRKSFKAFYAHVGPRPSPEHSIDRYPNNDGNYEPGNVRWATKKEQANNRRSSRLITVNGETKTLMQWGECTGLGWDVIKSRLDRGMSDEDAVSRELSTRGQKGASNIGAPGIERHKKGFVARTRINGQRRYVGLFKTIEEAAAARAKALEASHGNGVRTQQPVCQSDQATEKAAGG